MAGRDPEKEIPFLTVRTAGEQRKRYRSVRPLETEDREPLFAKLGSVSSPEGVVGFANEFGFLGVEFKESIRVARAAPEGKRRSYICGESVSAWMDEISTIRAMTELWRHVAKRGEEATRDCLLRQCEQASEESGGSPGRFDLLLLKQILASRENCRQRFGVDDVFGNLQRCFDQGGDAVSIAMDWIVDTVNVTLLEGVNAQLTWAKEVQRRPRAQLRLAPPSLCQAIWLQFAQAVRGKKAYEECPQCGSLFEVGVKLVGRPHSYCSGACKQKAYRRRKAEARRLWERGMSVEEIAKRLDVSEKSVESWTRPSGEE